MRFIALFFVLGLNFGFSQSTEKAVDSLFREDQVYLSISYNFIQNKPDNFSQFSFSTGLTAGVLRDIPISKNRHWSIAPGIGYSYNNLKQRIDFALDSDPLETSFVRSKLSLHYIEVPLEIRWRNASPESHKFWRIHTGFKVSYLLGGTFSFDSPDIGNESYKAKEFVNQWQYGVYVAFGFNTWNPYIYYGLNPIFDNKKENLEINITSLNIGLKFYIL